MSSGSETNQAAWKSDKTAALYNIGYDIGLAGLPFEDDAGDLGPAAAAYRKGWEDGARELRGDEPAPVVSAPGVEPVRLVIWDLDDTFWQGTLEEGGATLIPAHLETVKTLSARGIVNSIASKNNPDRVRAVLQKAGIWHHFVLPRIAFQPKGELVKSLIELCQLRPASVMFIDDNMMNLNEVTHYNPGVQTALPDFLPRLLADPRFAGKDDAALTRLRSYKILETREAERAVHVSDNTDFLRQSDIRISIHHDIFSEFGRIHELINRTNQLNFTKKRIDPDIDKARAAMRDHIDGTYQVRAAYIKIADRYGYYGICGFYLMTVSNLDHFLFSCRALNMGVEQLVYQKLGKPALDLVGEVAADPTALIVPDWISIVDDAETGTAGMTHADPAGPTIVLRGTCELQQAGHYLRERHSVVEELSYGKGAWGIVAGTSDYFGLRLPSLEPSNEAVFNRPWFDPEVMRSSAFTAAHDVYVLSFGHEPFTDRYRHKPTGIVLPFLLGGFDQQDLTGLDYATVKRDDLWLSEAQWNQMRAEFEFAWRFDADAMERNIAGMIDGLAGKRIILVLACTDYGWPDVTAQCAAANEVIERVAKSRPVTLLHMNDMVDSEADFIEFGHFRRDIYLRLANAIREVLAAPTAVPVPDLAPAPPPDIAGSTAMVGYRSMATGLNNQKLALLGLFLAACDSPARKMHLPDLVVYDAVDRNNRVVPAGQVYALDVLRRFVVAHGVEILPLPETGEDADAFPFFERGAIHLSGTPTQPRIPPTDIACDFLRHLTPVVCDTPIFQRLTQRIFTELGISIVVQMRIEKDWAIHAPANVAAEAEPNEDFAPSFATIIDKVRRSLNDWEQGVFVVCDEAALPVDKETIRAAAMAQFGMELFWKSDFLSADEWRDMTSLDLSILDFEIAVRSPIFVGMSRSSFSAMVTFETYARTRQPVTTHFIYNVPGRLLGRRTDNGTSPSPSSATAPPSEVAPAVSQFAGPLPQAVDGSQPTDPRDATYTTGRQDGLGARPATPPPEPANALAYKLGWNEGVASRAALSSLPQRRPLPVPSLKFADASPATPEEDRRPLVMQEQQSDQSLEMEQDVVPGANLLPQHDSMAGAAWVVFNQGEISESLLPGAYAEAAIKAIRLKAATDFGSFISFGCSFARGVSEGETYVLSASVWLPENFTGKEVTLCFAGFPSLKVQRARLDQTARWQRIWVSATVPDKQTSLFPTLAILGQENDEVHTTGWKLETGAVPSAYNSEL